MCILTQAYEVLQSVIESRVEKIALYGKFEDMSRENNIALVKHVHETIRDLRADREDKSSILSSRTNRSVVSRKSAKVFCPDPQRQVQVPPLAKEDKI